MNRLIAVLAIAVAACAAHAVNDAYPFTLAATNTTKATYTLATVNPTVTNWCYLAGMYVNMPARSEAQFEIATAFDGTNAVLWKGVTVANPNASTTNIWLPVRQIVSSSASPEVDKLPVYGQTTRISLTQTHAGTNSWVITPLMIR